MRKNLHGRILKEESKEQHLSTVSKSCSYIYIYEIHSSYTWCNSKELCIF